MDQSDRNKLNLFRPKNKTRNSIQKRKCVSCNETRSCGGMWGCMAAKGVGKRKIMNAITDKSIYLDIIKDAI